MIKKYFNTTNGPVVVNEDQKIVGGGEWAELESTDTFVKKARENGWLVEVKEPKVEEDKKEDKPKEDKPKGDSNDVPKPVLPNPQDFRKLVKE